MHVRLHTTGVSGAALKVSPQAEFLISQGRRPIFAKPWKRSVGSRPLFVINFMQDPECPIGPFISSIYPLLHFGEAFLSFSFCPKNHSIQTPIVLSIPFFPQHKLSLNSTRSGSVEAQPAKLFTMRNFRRIQREFPSRIEWFIPVR